MIANVKKFKTHQDVRNGAIDDKFDAIIWLGDINSRIQDAHGSTASHKGNGGGEDATGKDASMKNARRAISKSEYGELSRHDQFNCDMMNTKTPFNAYYYNFREGDCSLFAPTFKIIPGTN